MLSLRVVPKIHYFDTFADFQKEFRLGEGDVIVTNEWLYEPCLKPLGLSGAGVIYQEKYGAGEPSDEMIDAVGKELSQYDCQRLVAVGGGTIIDICKVLCLESPGNSIDLFTGKVPPKKVRELIVVPTTCGTGSEVTNVAIAELKSLHVKMGLAVEETYADHAVLIPESLAGLPDYVFSTSSIDALVHATESYLSPKATPFTEMFSLEAIRLIMEGFLAIVEKGNTKENRLPYLKDFALGSNYASIAFGNAGCAAVHALSYAIGGAFHVPHGESNYQFFTEVFKVYLRKDPDGKLAALNEILAGYLDCETPDVYDALEDLLNQLIPKKKLREYGMTEAQIDEFTKSTVDNQQRLLANNYVPLTDEEIREIFANLY